MSRGKEEEGERGVRRYEERVEGGKEEEEKMIKVGMTGDKANGAELGGPTETASKVLKRGHHSPTHLSLWIKLLQKTQGGEKEVQEGGGNEREEEKEVKDENKVEEYRK
ncbi:hypothetical protein Pcinc_015848 [Petrolisthes cinctipes]|uniref:Uncharacterized protein n=1 Tax=Petrolisthes cinctipes TaxID=88211 RepID=A0AAE1KQA9_PETCI|nr:hypothetical protein Pcinc_015848 [Petrolisthes cinctipes]